MGNIVVELTVSETVTYSQEVVMTQEQFDLISGSDSAIESEEEYTVIDNLIDRQDVLHNGGEFDDVQVAKVN